MTDYNITEKIAHVLLSQDPAIKDYIILNRIHVLYKVKEADGSNTPKVTESKG